MSASLTRGSTVGTSHSSANCIVCKLSRLPEPAVDRDRCSEYWPPGWTRIDQQGQPAGPRGPPGFDAQGVEQQFACHVRGRAGAHRWQPTEGPSSASPDHPRATNGARVIPAPRSTIIPHPEGREVAWGFAIPTGRVPCVAHPRPGTGLREGSPAHQGRRSSRPVGFRSLMRHRAGSSAGCQLPAASSQCVQASP